MTMNVDVISRGRGTRQRPWKWINLEVQDIDCLEKQREKTSQGAPVKKKKFSYAAERPSEIRILKHLFSNKVISTFKNSFSDGGIILVGLHLPF